MAVGYTYMDMLVAYLAGGPVVRVAVDTYMVDRSGCRCGILTGAKPYSQMGRAPGVRSIDLRNCLSHRQAVVFVGSPAPQNQQSLFRDAEKKGLSSAVLSPSDSLAQHMVWIQRSFQTR